MISNLDSPLLKGVEPTEETLFYSAKISSYNINKVCEELVHQHKDMGISSIGIDSGFIDPIPMRMASPSHWEVGYHSRGKRIKIEFLDGRRLYAHIDDWIVLMNICGHIQATVCNDYEYDQMFPNLR